VRQGLQYRYGFIIASLVVLVAVTLGSFLMLQYQGSFKSFSDETQSRTEQILLDQMEQRAISLSAILAENMKNPLYDLNMEQMLLLLRALNNSPDVSNAFVYDANGKIVHDGDPAIPSFGKRVVAEELLPKHTPEDTPVTRLNGETLSLWRSIWVENLVIGGVHIEFSLQTVELNLHRLKAEQDRQYSEAIQKIIILALVTTAILVLIGVLLSIMTSRRIVKPIQQVAEFASDIGEHNYESKLNYRFNDEIGDLINSFNDMSSKLQEEVLQREETEKQLRQLALYDSLTQLPNRTLILDRLSNLIEKAKRYPSRVAVMFVDLDDFKKVNDTLGHEAGDELLIESAKRFTQVIRPVDSVGRLGGDEFILLLDAMPSATDADRVAEEVLEIFKKPFAIDGRELTLSASIGISIFPEDGDNQSELLQKADSAMYHSKEKGRNTYSYFTAEMNEHVARRLSIEEQMYTALSKHEFTVYYQPKIRLCDGMIVGAEALLRWHNAELGQVAPDEFIPISEQTGFINPLGDFVLEQAVSDISLLNKRYDTNLHVAINVSPRQFRQNGLIDNVAEYLNEKGISRGMVELEITEGVLIGGQPNIECSLKDLRSSGIEITMDDFGTGYSSLSYLREYPFDVLKIDRSFVRDIGLDPEDRALIEAIIVMAHSLDLKVVAEGVETLEQADFLKERGCDSAQGYYFSHPLPLTEFEKYLSDFEL
jgi:diguanylate cyclase (GGDEF)-like protein